MAQDILDNVNSQLFVALNAMLPSGAPRIVKVYVEGESDVPFWTACLAPWCTAERRFEVSVYRRRQPDSRLSDQSSGHSEVHIIHSGSDPDLYDQLDNHNTQGNVERDCDAGYDRVRHITGKQNLLNEFDDSRLGPNLLLAIDADYDWIMEAYQYSPSHPEFIFSDRIRNCPYILHTYLYGIENFQCHPAALSCIWPKITGRTMPEDVKTALERWSEMMSELFMLHFISVDQCDFQYTLSTLKQWIHRFPVPFGKPESEWDRLRREIESVVSAEAQYLEGKGDIRARLESRFAADGFSEKDYCLLVCGHSFKNCGIMQHLPTVIVRDRQLQISLICAEGNESEREKLLIQFEKLTKVNRGNCVGDISLRLETLLDDFTDVHVVKAGYKRIQDDLRSIYE